MKDFKDKLIEKTENLILDNFESLIKNICDGVKYLACISIVVFIFKHLLKFSLELAIKNNIKITGTDYVTLMKEFGIVVVFIILIGILSRPIVKIANKIKKISKDEIEMFGDEEQNINLVPIKIEVQKDTVEDILNSDDRIIFEEKTEENIYTRAIENGEEINNLLKCKNIKDNMKPLTAIITIKLYNNNKDNINKEIIYEYICNEKNRKRKKLEEQNRKLAQNIIEYLKKNDIIEADDIEDKFYFTPFGNIFMNYFQKGII